MSRHPKAGAGGVNFSKSQPEQVINRHTREKLCEKIKQGGGLTNFVPKCSSSRRLLWGAEIPEKVNSGEFSARIFDETQMSAVGVIPPLLFSDGGKRILRLDLVGK